MNIRLIKPWGLYSAGMVFTDMPRCQRDILMEQGYAVEDNPKTPTRFGKLKIRGGRNGHKG